LKGSNQNLASRSRSGTSAQVQHNRTLANQPQFSATTALDSATNAYWKPFTARCRRAFSPVSNATEGSWLYPDAAHHRREVHWQNAR
jgi:hypothetical protein